MKISALWITKNEEENIERSIKSVSGIADELIVVDTGSVDQTVSLAESLGAKVYNFKWINDFSAAKNFAIEHAGGEFFIFLDADEWFEPALAESDRDVIAQTFSDKKVDGISCMIQNLDGSGGMKSASMIGRIFRRQAGVRYTGRIHEKMTRADGLSLKIDERPKLTIFHTGYADDKVRAKSERNLAMLELREEGGAKLSALEKFYLMRENFFADNLDKTYEYFIELLRSKKAVAELAVTSVDIAPLYFYIGIDIAETLRNRVSRKEIYAGLVTHMKTTLPDYPGSAFMELYYRLFFAHDEKKFLAGLQEYEKTKKEDNTRFTDTYDKPALQRIYDAGAEAELALGNNEAAMSYALKAMTCFADKPQGSRMKIFIRALKGADETSVILLLSKISGAAGSGVLDSFLEGLMYERLKNAYLYFFKKQYDEGKATKSRFLYLKILNGGPKEAVETALSNRGEMLDDALEELVFCAVLCADDYEFFLGNKEHLGKYTNVAEAYFENRPLADLGSEDMMIYMTEYRNIVFAAGKAAGDRFLSVFEGSPSFRFMIKCSYYMDGALYEEFLSDEEDIDTSVLSIAAQVMFARCCAFAGQYLRALSLLKKLFENNQLSYKILNVIFMIAERAPGSVKEEARLLYDEYSAVLEETLDIEDILNTGVAFDEITKKEKHALSALSPQAFKKEVLSAPPAASERLCNLYMIAAQLYIEKGFPGMAEKYLRRLLASGHKTPEVYKDLSAVYEKLGNTPLAKELAKSI